MSFLFQIIQTEEQPALSVSILTSAKDLPRVVGGAMEKVVKYISAQGEQAIGPAFIAYHNWDMENLQVEIGFPLIRAMPGEGEMVLRPIPAGRKASGFHKGPYSDIGPVYDALAKFYQKKGYEATGVSYEYYYNSPDEVPPSELLTKVEFLLK